MLVCWLPTHFNRRPFREEAVGSSIYFALDRLMGNWAFDRFCLGTSDSIRWVGYPDIYFALPPNGWAFPQYGLIWFGKI